MLLQAGKREAGKSYNVPGPVGCYERECTADGVLVIKAKDSTKGGAISEAARCTAAETGVKQAVTLAGHEGTITCPDVRKWCPKVCDAACPSYLIANVGGTCRGETCTEAECCKARPCDISCAAPGWRKFGATCKSVTCTEAECCEQPKACDVACPAHLKATVGGT